jgi:cullin-4
LDVSQHQALVLLLFNDTGSSALSCSSIQASTGIEMEELKRTLQSLALGQVRVLKKEQKGREVEDSDTFVFNAGFSHALVRIKINQIQAKETKQEVDSTHERVVQDRQFQVDAALVRIMKARKVISHVTLMGELISQLRFPCDASVIKKRIESLIDRDYLERHPDDPSQYRYVA